MIKIIKFLIFTSVVSVGFANADHHAEPEPMIAEIFECTLNDGATANDVLALGKKDFNKFVASNDLNMNAYLWEAISINPPYDDADTRWVNYFPTWGDHAEANAMWRKKGAKLQAKLDALQTCQKPIYMAVHNAGARPPQTQEKPLVTQVCNLNEGKNISDALEYGKAFNSMANNVADTQVGSALFTPGFGVSGFDYVAMVAGSEADMIKIMDGVRDGSMSAAAAEAGLQNPATCVFDLHRSHLMVLAQD